MNPGLIDERSVELLPDIANAERAIQWWEHNHKRVCHGMRDMHYGLEFAIVLAGRVKQIYPNWETIVGPGEAWLCGMWEPHGYDVVKAPARFVGCRIWPPLLASLRFSQAAGFDWFAPFAAPPRERPQAPRKSRPRMRALAERLLAVDHEPEGHQEVWPVLIVMETLLELTRNWTPPSAHRRASLTVMSRVSPAIELVFARRRFLSVQEAARACGMSRNHFSRLFGEVMGISFPQFALRYRLSCVAGQLTSTDAPIKTVASAWGFTDDSHLHHQFRRHYGMSPSEYRRRRSGAR